MSETMTPQEIAAIVIGVLMTIGIFALCVYFAKRILRGEGDDLIAGYNTLSPEKQAMYDVGRVRKLTGYSIYVFLGYSALLAIPLLLHNDTLVFVHLAGYLPLIAVYLWLANTWAKRKVES